MSLAIAEIDREPRVLDLEMANRLGFARPREIRTMIARNRAELEQYGEVIFRAAEASRKGGRPTKECWLNEGQALLLCMFSQTNRAAAVRKELIDVFMDWRQKTVAVRKHSRRPPLRHMSRQMRPMSMSRIGGADGMVDLSFVVSERVAHTVMLAFCAEQLAEIEHAPKLIGGVFS